MLVASHVVFNTSLDDLRGNSFDFYQTADSRTAAADNVVVVGVDDETIGVEGRWPWPRDRIADLVTAIHASGVSVLGIDVLFSESDDEVPAVPHVTTSWPPPLRHLLQYLQPVLVISPVQYS